MLSFLKKNEHVITAFAAPKAGPGWANQPIVAIIQEGNNPNLRMEYIQPKDQTPEMLLLYNISEAVHLSMSALVEERMGAK